MDTIKVNKDGSLDYYGQIFRKTDDPKPTPLDPSELSLFKQGYDSAQDELDALVEDGSDADTAPEGEESAAEEDEAMEASLESKMETQEAADSAGVEALAGGSGE